MFKGNLFTALLLAGLIAAAVLVIAWCGVSTHAHTPGLEATP